MTDEITFPALWIGAERFEQALRNSPSALQTDDMSVRVVIPEGCNIMVDAGIRLLSYTNQLQKVGKSVVVDFAGGSVGTMGYLDRMGFFELLHSNIEVRPGRPSISKADIYRGTNPNLVEFERINPDHEDNQLPSRLVNALLESIGEAPRRGQLETAAFTILGEMIGNVYEHSETGLDGYAVLQSYNSGRTVRVAVSDSGKGLLETLRPSLPTYYPALVGCGDTELLVELFRQGLSRHGKARGSGLKAAAERAMKFKAAMDVRLPMSYIRLVPSLGGYQADKAIVYNNVPLIWGTHIAFDFRLDGVR